MIARSSVEKTSEIKRHIRFEIPHEEYQQKFNQLLERTTQRVNVKGFRPGRAPKALVAKMYEGSLQQDVMQTLISTAFQDAVKEHELRVVGTPEVELGDYEEGKELTFTAKVDVFPEPTISDYFGVSFEVELQDEAVDNKAIDEQIESMRENFATFSPVTDRTTVETGDVLTIDFHGNVDGAEFPGSHGHDARVEVGAEKLPKDFDEGLIGMGVGETRTIKTILPDEIEDRNLAGKEATYEVKLKEISAKVLPTVDDELAKKTGLGETVAELREKVAKMRAKQAVDANERVRRDKLFEALVEKNLFEVPQHLVDEEIREILFEMGVLDRRRQEAFQIDVSRFREPLQKGGEFRVRRYIMLEALVKQENLAVSEEELDAWLSEKVEDAGMPKDELKKAFGLPKNAEQVKKMVARERMTEQLLAKAKIKAVKAEAKSEEDVAPAKKGKAKKGAEKAAD